MKEGPSWSVFKPSASTAASPRCAALSFGDDLAPRVVRLNHGAHPIGCTVPDTATGQQQAQDQDEENPAGGPVWRFANAT